MISAPTANAAGQLGYGSLIRTYLGPQWRRVLALAGLLAAGIALQLASPQVLRAFVDAATTGAALEVLARLAVAYLAFAILNQVAVVVETYVAENVGLTATNEIRVDLTRHCLDLDLGFHHAHTPGELIERVDGDVTALSNFFSRFVVQVLGNGVLLLGILVLLILLDPRIGGPIALCTVLTVAVLLRIRNLGVGIWTAERQANAELFGFLEERLAGTEDLRSAGATGYALRRLAERSLAVLRAEQRGALVAGGTGGAGNLLLTLITVVGLATSGPLYLSGAVTIGTVYLVFSYSQLLRWPIQQITRQLQDFQRAGASVGRIRALLTTRSRLGADGQARLPGGPLPVELDHVWFSYEDGEAVLRDVSLAIRPGEVVGLLGRTGSGKTTIARLVSRLYDPSGGAIRLGGVDLREALPADVRRVVGVVTQDIQLFHASVRDNLTLFDRRVSDEQIVSVLRELGLWEWCVALPDGLQTRLAPGGSGLSAGEAQLLAFARVFLKDPGLVILDEASSRLDPATEARIELALDRLLRGRTAIVIAHRLATVERTDTIVILEDGAIRERGPRLDLARDPASQFAHLLRVGLEAELA